MFTDRFGYISVVDHSLSRAQVWFYGTSGSEGGFSRVAPKTGEPSNLHGAEINPASHVTLLDDCHRKESRRFQADSTTMTASGINQVAV
jgi:hypothetical protein